MSFPLGRTVKAVKCIAATAAGTSAVDGATVDTSGYEGVLFVAHMGAITAAGVQSLSADQGDASPATDALAGSKVVIPDDGDDQIYLLDIYRPRKRFVRPVLARATQNSVINSVVAYLYGAKLETPAADASEGATRVNLQSPAEGAI